MSVMLIISLVCIAGFAALYVYHDEVWYRHFQQTNDEWLKYAKELRKEIESIEKRVDNIYMRLDKLEDDGR